jgi:NAD(P)-dependent dehydrogenase (short-subunit alcohol dehydrogenase family)
MARRGRCREDRCASQRGRCGDGAGKHRRRDGRLSDGRFSTPEEVATLVVLLASPRTANVTGANYVIDGGLIKTT